VSKFTIGSGFVHIRNSWPEFREIISSKGCSVQYLEEDDCYRVFAIDGTICYSTIIFTGSVEGRTDASQQDNDEWKEDFETSIMPFSNFPLEHVREDGVRRVQIEPANVSKRAKIKGFKLECSLAEDEETPTKTTIDFEWDTTISFQGIDGIWAADHHRDDYVELWAYCREGTSKTIWEQVFGEWPFGEATETPADTPIYCFGETVYLPDSGRLPQIVAEGVFEVPTFIGLRLDYWSHAHTGNAPYVTGMFRIWVTP
jgi:hypothetical protein